MLEDSKTGEVHPRPFFFFVDSYPHRLTLTGFVHREIKANPQGMLEEERVGLCNCY